MQSEVDTLMLSSLGTSGWQSNVDAATARAVQSGGSVPLSTAADAGASSDSAHEHLQAGAGPGAPGRGSSSVWRQMMGGEDTWAWASVQCKTLTTVPSSGGGTEAAPLPASGSGSGSSVPAAWAQGSSGSQSQPRPELPEVDVRHWVASFDGEQGRCWDGEGLLRS